MKKTVKTLLAAVLALGFCLPAAACNRGGGGGGGAGTAKGHAYRGGNA